MGSQSTSTLSKTCTECGEEKPADAFYTSRGGSKCKVCECARVKVWRDNNLEQSRASAKKWRDENPERAAESKRRWRAKNPSARKWRSTPAALKSQRDRYYRDREKVVARYTVNNAIRDGKLIRPKNCRLCCMPGKVEAHHTDYSHPLDVQWLCRGCHKKQHGRHNER